MAGGQTKDGDRLIEGVKDGEVEGVAVVVGDRLVEGVKDGEVEGESVVVGDGLVEGVADGVVVVVGDGDTERGSASRNSVSIDRVAAKLPSMITSTATMLEKSQSKLFKPVR